MNIKEILEDLSEELKILEFPTGKSIINNLLQVTCICGFFAIFFHALSFIWLKIMNIITSWVF